MSNGYGDSLEYIYLPAADTGHLGKRYLLMAETTIQMAAIEHYRRHLYGDEVSPRQTMTSVFPSVELVQNTDLVVCRGLSTKMREYMWKTLLCRLGFPWSSFILFFCFGASAGQYSLSQGRIAPPVSSQEMPAHPLDLFSTDLEILSRRLGVTFIAEGSPLPVTKIGPAPSLNEALSKEDSIQEIADYFDYSVTRQGTVYLLLKRYTNPDDLPEVTLQECLNGLKAISKILAPFNPKFPPSTFAGKPEASIARLLTDDQAEKLGKSGLPVSELTVPQREEAWRLARKFYLQSEADHIEETVTALENRHPVDLVFHWQTIMNIRAFGYDTRSIELNKLLFIPVSNSNQIIVLPNGATAQIKSVHKHNGVIVPEQDPTDPTGLSETTKRFLDDKGKYSHTISLVQAITTLNRQATNHLVYKVDPIYGTKHLTLVEAGKLPADVLIRSLATIYGLRLVREKDGTILLTHPVVLEAKQISDLKRVLQGTIPAPIYRAMQTRKLSSHDETRDMEKPVLMGQYQIRASAIHHSAMQMFRYVTETAAMSKPQKHVALSELSTWEQSMFALSSTLTSFAQACWLTDRPAPPYIADFDHVTLTGGITRNAEGVERCSLYFSYLNPKTGITYKGVGFADALVP